MPGYCVMPAAMRREPRAVLEPNVIAMLLGCIADDFTGASDIANTLSLGGMQTRIFVGVPDRDTPPGEWVAEAGVVALKTRSIPAATAVQESLRALAWLRERGCQQFVFKYCSTFDSTPRGNIGPVASALARALNATGVVVCPAFPANGRTVYQGHLFVRDKLLSESGMEQHPLTPMTDPDLRRWLARQCDERIGHIDHATMRAGVIALRNAIAARGTASERLLVVDAITDADLMTLGEALVDAPLLTGGSGIAIGLPDNFRRAGAIAGTSHSIAGLPGRAALLAGSCSTATRAQVRRYAEKHPVLAIDTVALMAGHDVTRVALEFQKQHADAAPLIYSSAEPAVVAAAQHRYGPDSVASAIERLFGEVAKRVVAAGVRKLVIAGGETCGAVVSALGLRNLLIGPQIAPGVPVLLSMASQVPLALALKSGNFGGDDFFVKALQVLGGESD